MNNDFSIDSVFITFILEMKQFYMFIFFRCPFHFCFTRQQWLSVSILSLIRMYNLESIQNTNIGRIKVDQYEKKSVLAHFVPYWRSCTICITKAVFILFM